MTAPLVLVWPVWVDCNWFMLRWCDSKCQLGNADNKQSPNLSDFKQQRLFLAHHTCPQRAGWVLCYCTVTVIILKPRLTRAVVMERKKENMVNHALALNIFTHKYLTSVSSYFTGQGKWHSQAWLQGGRKIKPSSRERGLIWGNSNTSLPGTWVEVWNPHSWASFVKLTFTHTQTFMHTYIHTVCMCACTYSSLEIIHPGYHDPEDCFGAIYILFGVYLYFKYWLNICTLNLICGLVILITKTDDHEVMCYPAAQVSQISFWHEQPSLKCRTFLMQGK